MGDLAVPLGSRFEREVPLRRSALMNFFGRMMMQWPPGDGGCESVWFLLFGGSAWESTRVEWCNRVGGRVHWRDEVEEGMKGVLQCFCKWFSKTKVLVIGNKMVDAGAGVCR